MKYEKFAKSIFQNLGIKKTYKGLKYTTYILHLLSENESNIEMLIKCLYAETAKKYDTSWKCVEKNIRKVITLIWDISENKDLIIKIFGNEHLDKKPTNKEFLSTLYQYAKLKSICSEVLADYQVDYICPTTGKSCTACMEMTKQIIEKYERKDT